jgi:Domain of unknown function (DUF397)
VTRPAAAGGAKPTPADLGIDPATLNWERSGDADAGAGADGSIEVAFPAGPRWARGDWVLVRVAGDPAGRILVFDRNEWESFIDGARNGEFDAAADLLARPAEPPE